MPLDSPPGAEGGSTLAPEYHLPSGPLAADYFASELDLEPVRSVGTRLRRNILVRNLILNPVNVVGVIILLIVAFLTIFGPSIAPYSPIKPDYTSMLTGPSHLHWFGTDQIGDDIFSRVLAGARLSIFTAIGVLAIALVIGLSLGAIAGFAGGWLDEVIMRLTDMFLAFPSLILALAIATSLGPGLTSAAIALSMGFWPWYARLLRGQVLALKNLEYVTAATSLGVSRIGILWRHILPNALGPIIVELSLDMGYAVLSTAALSFIGLGAQPPSPEWGAMIVSGRDYLSTGPWATAFPGLALTLTVLAFNLVGDGLRDSLDPRGQVR
jgi:peptide/nickel transport system permease protein